MMPHTVPAFGVLGMVAATTLGTAAWGDPDSPCEGPLFKPADIVAGLDE
jgi:hypothetical protein